MNKLFNKQGYTIHFTRQLIRDAEKEGIIMNDAEKFAMWLVEESEYRVIKYYDDSITWYQRLNRVWFCPLYLVFVAPVKWVVTGSTGIEERSVFRNLMYKLTGF